jgi:Rne/Rng family ribonuclease
MTKEMLISSSPHETKIALLEDDQLVEIYYERDTDVGLAGGIYKGRVSRVLPGMQSAFVDIGLERDAFLYVSDFFEDSDEYDRVFTEAENRVARVEQDGAKSAEAAAPTEPATELSVNEGGDQAPASENATPAPPSSETAEPLNASASESPAGTSPSVTDAAPPASPSRPTEPHHHGFQGHGRRRRGRRFPGHRFGGPKPEFHDRPKETSAEEHHQGLELLPGESLARYGHGESETPEGTEGASETPAAELATDVTDDERAGSVESYEAHSQTPNASATAGETVPAPIGHTDRANLAAELKSKVPTDSEATSDQETIDAESSENELIGAAERAEDDDDNDGVEDEREEVRLDRAVPESDQVASLQSLAATDDTAGPAKSFVTELEPTATHEPVSAESSDSQTPAATEDSEVNAESEDPSDVSVESLLDDDHVEQDGEEALETTTESGEGAEGRERSYTLRESHQRPRFAPRRQRRGRGRFGFRGSREGGRKNDAPRAGNFQAVQISEVLKEGQEILVQIAKEPLGTKGARITSHVALPGRYLVYMPTISHIGVSRKISSEDERLRLRNTILENRGSLTGGIIVRTAAAGRSEEELKADLRFLGTLWNDIRAKTERSKAPALIHRDLNVVQRTLRDLLSPDFRTIRIDNEIEYEQVVDFVNRCQPSLVGHVRLYTRDVPLFEEFGVQQEIDKALKPKVWLKSGGYIVINQTEALISIDVNTGKYVGKTNRLEDTIVRVNIDAVKEIVRQIRIRDLGGIIVIDFIDMDDRRNRNKVVQALDEALRADRAPTKILSFNEFGLVALTRKRVKHSLERTLCEPCPYCTGSGWVKSVLTVSYEIIAEARKMASQIEGNVMTLRVHPEVARALKSRDSVLLSEMETATRKEVVIKSDPSVQQERFEIF